VKVIDQKIGTIRPIGGRRFIAKPKRKIRAKIMLINKKNAAGIQPEENEIIQQARRTSSCRVSFSGIKKIVRAEILGKGYNIYK